MATVTHYIYSDYDPIDRERLEIETGQVLSDEKDGKAEADPWQTESSFGGQRRLTAAPRFVPAAVSYDEINEMIGASARFLPDNATPQPSSSDAADWYRSLARVKIASSSSETRPRSASPSTVSSALDASVAQASKERKERWDKNNWFITRALQSEPPSTSVTPTLTLADILSREPPPSRDKPFKPPVFLALGPSNKGWAMLQQSGWCEGEGLGTGVPRSLDTIRPPSSSPAKAKGKARSRQVAIKQEERETFYDDAGEIIEVRKVDVVDLTLSDSENDEVRETMLSASVSFSSASPASTVESHTTPILTPIPTVLKSDRLGIGLKAKTVGPYKESKKRITHNQAALAAHIRANEEMRRTKVLVGRGSRGFARLAKVDEEHRRQLLANLNSD